MYYLEMKTVIKAERQLKTYSIRNQASHLTEKCNTSATVIDSKFYQKLFAVLFALSIFLIFPESPKEIDNLCKIYNFSQICNVW